MLAPISGTPSLVNAPLVFPVRASYFDEINLVVRQAHAIGEEDFVFVHLDAPAALAFTEQIKTQAEAHGGRLLEAIRIQGTGVTAPGVAADELRLLAQLR